MILGKFFRRQLAIFLSVVMLLPSLSINASSQEIKDRIVIQVGAPSVWSMGQAHYLLTQMHRENRRLATNMPGKDALDPNAINATKLQLLKTLLDIQAQFDQKLGIENRTKLREYERKLADRDSAKNELVSITAQIQTLDNELAEQKKDLARKQVEYNQKKANPATPPARFSELSEEVKLLEQEIAVLDTDIKQKEKQRSELADRKSKLEAQAITDVSVSGLQNVDLSGDSGQLPGFSKFGEDYLTKAIGKVDLPRLAATIALDNFIGMQYEIISKQLTLLRDEVGRDQRIIFLELPASIYSVADKGDDYVAQVRWQVKYFAESSKDEIDNSDIPDIRIARSSEPQDKTKRANIVEQLNMAKKYEAYKSEKKCDLEEKSGEYPDKNGDKKDRTICWQIPNTSYVRALDIIPHQNSLNINDVQGTTRHKNFLGILKLVSGFGLQLNYQRQQEVYEQFLRQETFASGFGKGLTTFGWTFGPQPGTKRISPGVRTMYAVMVVPEKTKLLRLEADGIAYHRKKAPDYFANQQATDPQDPKTFDVIIPNSAFANWYTDYIHYTPVNPGETVTAVIRGEGFTPQTSVLIDGVALRSVHSVGTSAQSDAGTDNDGATGIHGQFEVVNSRQLIIKFSMGNDKYIGTPTINIVAPEKSAPINFYEIKEINGRHDESLFYFSVREPMFIEKFTLDKKLYASNDTSVSNPNFVKAKLKGNGLRRTADIWVNNHQIEYNRRCELNGVEDCLRSNPDSEFVTQTDTKEYFLYFPRPKTDKWTIRFRQKTVRGFDVEEFEHVLPPKPDATLGLVEVFRYSANPETRKATIEVRFGGTEPPDAAELIPLGIRKTRNDFYQESNKAGEETWRAIFIVDYENLGVIRKPNFIERDKVSVKVTRFGSGGDSIRTTNLTLPLRPQIKSIALSLPPVPDEQGSVVTVHGINLQNVGEVFIANQKATIVAPPSNDSITVRLSKGVFIREEKGVKVPVTLVTKDGQSVSAVITIGTSETDKPSKPAAGRAKKAAGKT